MSFKSFISSKNPGKGLYIFVWFITWVPINIIVGIVDTIIASLMLKNIDDWNTYVFIAFPIETLIYGTVRLKRGFYIINLIWGMDKCPPYRGCPP